MEDIIPNFQEKIKAMDEKLSKVSLVEETIDLDSELVGVLNKLAEDNKVTLNTLINVILTEFI